MEKIQAIKKLKTNGLRMFLMNKIKKYGTRNVALAVQSALHLFRTGAFDLRTMTILSRPMKKQAYENLKYSVTEHLNKTASSV